LGPFVLLRPPPWGPLHPFWRAFCFLLHPFGDLKRHQGTDWFPDVVADLPHRLFLAPFGYPDAPFGNFWAPLCCLGRPPGAHCIRFGVLFVSFYIPLGASNVIRERTGSLMSLQTPPTGCFWHTLAPPSPPLPPIWVVFGFLVVP
jgi:hypothetical protein